MTLLERQIKAVEETRLQCQREHFNHKLHHWKWELCPLCAGGEFCDNCLIFEEEYDCVELARYDDNDDSTATPQAMACFLYSLEIYLKELKNECSAGVGVVV